MQVFYVTRQVQDLLLQDAKQDCHPLTQVKESNKKVNLSGRPPQHTEVGKEVQTGRLEMALSEEHIPMHQGSSGHWNEVRGWGGGGSSRSNNCPICGVVSMPQYFLSVTYRNG